MQTRLASAILSLLLAGFVVKAQDSTSEPMLYSAFVISKSSYDLGTFQASINPPDQNGMNAAFGLVYMGPLLNKFSGFLQIRLDPESSNG